MASTTLTNAANLHLYYEKKLLSVLEPRLVLQPLGKKQRLPKGNGKRVKWLRYSTINSSVVPLTEGTVPAEIAFTTGTVQADIEQYGQYAKVSDLLSDTAIDPVMENLSERFGIAASKTIEELIISEISQNCANQNVNGRLTFAAIGATPGQSDVLNHKELIEAMIRQKADLIGPHESGDYVCVLHAHAEYDLLSDTQAGSFLDIQKYTDNRPVLNGEIGRMYGMRFLVSDKMLNSLPAVHGGPSNVVQSFVIGEEAFGVVELNGDAMKMIMKKHGSAGAVDPLDQFATVGYKINGFAAKYLQTGSKRVIAVNSASSLT
jgi:N4-gp56 family major capsid protein